MKAGINDNEGVLELCREYGNSVHFIFAPLPDSKVSLVKPKYNALGEPQPDQDILKAVKILARKIASDEKLTNKTTAQPINITTNRRQFTDCLQQEFKSPEITELSSRGVLIAILKNFSGKIMKKLPFFW